MPIRDVPKIDVENRRPSRNKLVTRGLGPLSGGVPGRSSMVSQGLGGFFQNIKRQAIRIIQAGQSGTKRALQELQEVMVWAKLIRINDEKPPIPITGSIKVRISKTSQIAAVLVSRASVRVRSALEDLKITVKRIK
jgi:hypothetical protein